MSQKNGRGEEKKRLFCIKLKRKNGKIGANFNVTMYIYYRPIFLWKVFYTTIFYYPLFMYFYIIIFYYLYYSYL